uniref:NAC domain-containing protein n=1 Tax=Oryza brachyantha TaxID=4533 RepID=J3ND39_ORYBR
MASLSLDFLLAIGFRFNPSPQEIVSYYLPLLIAGEQPEDTRDCIHHADVYGADMDVEPGRLAGRFAPVARSTSSDRFFFTACRRVKRRVSRIAGRGTWVAQSTTDVKNEEKVKIGELKTFKFKKERGRDDYSDWLMEEYHCHPGGEEAGDVEPVVCRIIRLDEFVRFVHDEPEAELLEESLVDAILAPETQEEESSNPMEGFVAPADGDELLKS